jgi:hypothetical protein
LTAKILILKEKNSELRLFISFSFFVSTIFDKLSIINIATNKIRKFESSPFNKLDKKSLSKGISSSENNPNVITMKTRRVSAIFLIS